MKLSFSIRELSKALFCIGVFTKQFYILPSGSFQLGDLFFMLSFLSCIGLGKVRIAKIDFSFMTFVLLACIINMSAFLSDGFYGNGLTVSMFYVYNLLAVIAFRNSFRSLDDLLSLSKVMLVSMLTQLVLYLGGGGRWYSSGRYMGTFNDPNQYGFFVLSAIFFTWIIYKSAGFKLRFLCLVCGSFLVMLSSSTGMILGIGAFAGGLFLVFLYNHLSRSVFRFLLAVCIIICIVVFYILFFGNTKIIVSSDSNLISRLAEKINKFSGNFISGFVKDRNMTRVMEHPEFLLVGSSEGASSRFNIEFGEGGDIHSDMFSLLFSYGIIPFSILMVWIILNMRGLAAVYIPVYLGLIMESITLVNHRQPLFWCLIAMASFDEFKRNKASTQSEVPVPT